MREIGSKFVLTILLIFVSSALAETELGKPEYRMAWILTYDGNLINSPESIKTAVDACRDNNLNALIPIVRRRGRAYYDSKIEPRFNPYPEQGSSFDSLAEFIKHAHDTSNGKRRLEVHSWVVISPVWMEETSPPAGHIVNL
ncbi:MAG: family 10 glycosylhydrolase, partial [Candidatus Sumerlaeia bacterium]|nr:family 10 glycosylhydrolase [Candidatus Sumerlaeia bacterium]